MAERMRLLPGRQGLSLWPELVEMFRAGDEARLEALARLVAERRSDELARLAHTVAGSCTSVGAIEALAFMQGLEEAALAGNWTDVAMKMDELPKVWRRLHGALAETTSLSLS